VQEIKLIAGGAAQGLVAALAPRFMAVSGYGIEGTFGAVGAMKARLEAAKQRMSRFSHRLQSPNCGATAD
jgi:hypothetical protein